MLSLTHWVNKDINKKSLLSRQFFYIISSLLHYYIEEDGKKLCYGLNCDINAKAVIIIIIHCSSVSIPSFSYEFILCTRNVQYRISTARDSHVRRNNHPSEIVFVYPVVVHQIKKLLTFVVCLFKIALRRRCSIAISYTRERVRNNIMGINLKNKYTFIGILCANITIAIDSFLPFRSSSFWSLLIVLLFFIRDNSDWCGWL